MTTLSQTTNQTSEEERYKRLLEDNRWKAIRNEVIKRDGFRCINCSVTGNLQVHHKQYHVYSTTGKWKAPWEYELRLLITLCMPCHEKGHHKYKIPVFRIK